MFYFVFYFCTAKVQLKFNTAKYFLDKIHFNLNI